MSLILRKECQEVLDNNNLLNVHVGISNTKSLEIVGECGQPLVSIPGITFARLPPTNAEIKYCVELFDSFLAKHGKDIQAYMKARETFKALPEVPMKHEDGYKIVIDKNYRTQDTIFSVKYMDGPFSIRYAPNKPVGEALIISLNESVHDGSVLSEYEFNNLKFAAAKEHLDNYITYHGMQKALSDMLAELSVCDI